MILAYLSAIHSNADVSSFLDGIQYIGLGLATIAFIVGAGLIGFVHHGSVHVSEKALKTIEASILGVIAIGALPLIVTRAFG
jgi:hypothetical protein